MKFFQRGEFKLLWPFYLEYFLSSVLYLIPAFLIVYFSDIGLSAFQMGILYAVWPLSSLIFEIPTGAFADLYGRKKSVLLGYFLEALGILSLFFWKEFKLMLISFAFLGLAATFSSGSKDAWIVDKINKKDKKMMHGFFNKMQFFINSGLVFSGIIGALLVKNYGLSVIWIVTFFSYLLSITLLYFFAKEDYIRRKTNLSESLSKLKEQTKKSLKYSYNHHVLFYIIFAGTIAMLASNLQGGISWIPLLKSLGMKEYYFGYLWSIMALVMAISPIFAIKFLRKEKERNFIIITSILWVVTTALVIFANNIILALIVMLLGLFFYCSANPSEEVYFHRFVPSKLRATVGSVKNMMFSIAVIIILPIEGWLVDNIGSKHTIFISAILMIPAIILYSRIKER
jgi:MFS family permease